MTDEHIKELKEEMAVAKKGVEIAYTQLLTARNEYKEAEESYKQKKEIADSIDRQLAMVDGRFKKVKSSVSGRIKKKDLSINLNSDQVIRIAEVLGIELEIE